jgi:Outer membrane protein beta-barrel family/CarboxypepD_reg-like domain
MFFSAQLQGGYISCSSAAEHEKTHPAIKLFMRISLLIITIGITSLHLLLAFPCRAQDMSVEKVRVGLNQEPVMSAIRQIEKQTTLRFFYRKAEVNQLGVFDLPSARRTIEQTLLELLQNSSLTFRQVDQNILIEANSQETQAKRIISGTILSEDTHEPVKFAMIELIRKKDLQLVARTSTDTSGKFELITGDRSEHSLRISEIGYHVFSVGINDTADVKLRDILLKPDPQELSAVVIAGHSPIVKQEVDRLVYNVQADPENKSSSLLDMLRKVPLISVDAEDNIKLKGSNSFKVLIDGRLSSLVVNDPKEIFRSMSASNIQSIEVITIPPAKYDAEGLAGIINIITVKKISDGYSGNFDALYKYPNGPRTNASINLKRGKFAVSAFGGLTEYDFPLTGFSLSRMSNYPTPSVIIQNGSAETKSRLGYISTQASYEADNLNLLTLIINYNGSSNHRLSSLYTSQTTQDSLSSYVMSNNAHTTQHAFETGFDYQHSFKASRSQVLSFSYRYTDSKSDHSNLLRPSQEVNDQLGNLNQDDHSGSRENTFQLDYTHQLPHLIIEGGLKAILRDNFSNYTVDGIDSLGNTFLDTTNSDEFSYKQNIYSAYNAYQLNLNSWTIKTGLRLERTTVDADFSSAGTVPIPSYNSFIPSIAVQKKLTQFESINFGYTDRIQRPGILQLNPYIDRSDPNFINYGNPELKPETNHILSANYSSFRNVSFYSGLSYSFSDNTIQYVTTLGSDGVTRGSYLNLGKNNNLEGDMNLSFPISHHMNLSLNAQASYIHLTGMIDTTIYSKHAMTGNANLNLSYRLSHEWRVVLNFQYYSPAITLQSVSSLYFYSSVSLSKTFLKKLNVFVSASNPYLKYLNYKITTADPRFTEITHNDIVYRRFNIGINLQFGKLKEGSIKKNKKSIQNDDIKIIPASIPNN